MQAAFKNVAEEQQHIAGPAHRKALARQQAEQEQKERVARGKGAADCAVVSFATFGASVLLFACLPWPIDPSGLTISFVTKPIAMAMVY